MPLLDVRALSDHTLRPPPAAIEDMDSEIFCVDIPLGGLPLKAIDTLMEGLISDEILHAPWYLPTGVTMALRLGPRPALPPAAPIVTAKTLSCRGSQPHETVIEVLSEDRTVVGRATIRYATPVVRDPGPTLSTFQIAPVAARDAALVQAAIEADAWDHPETRQVLTTMRRGEQSETDAQRNLLAARILLIRGVEAFVSQQCDPELSYTWPLRAVPALWTRQQLPLLRWRGFRLRRGWWCVFLGNGESTFYAEDPEPEEDAQEDAQDEEMQAALRTTRDAEAANDAARTLEACERQREVRMRTQAERAMRSGMDVAATAFEVLKWGHTLASPGAGA